MIGWLIQQSPLETWPSRNVTKDFNLTFSSPDFMFVDEWQDGTLKEIHFLPVLAVAAHEKTLRGTTPLAYFTSNRP